MTGTRQTMTSSGSESGERSTLRLYTDGSCPAPGAIGGWAWILSRRALGSLRLGPNTRPIDPSAVRADRGNRGAHLPGGVRDRGGRAALRQPICRRRDELHRLHRLHGLGARCSGARMEHHAPQAGRQPGTVGATPRTEWLPRRQLAPRARSPAEEGHQRGRPPQPCGRCIGAEGPPGLIVPAAKRGMKRRAGVTKRFEATLQEFARLRRSSVRPSRPV